MSHEAIDAFWKKVETDRELCRELDRLLAGSGTDREVHASALVPLARRHGFEFTEAELRSRAEACDDAELSDKDLDAVAGGCEVDTKTVAKAFKVEVNGQFLPVQSYSGGDLTGEKAEASSGASQHNETTTPVRIQIRL